jgi:hypothetical protein
VLDTQATPGIVDLLGAPPAESILAWNTANGARVQVFAVDDAGLPVEPALLDTTTPGEVGAGNLTVAPGAGTNTYRLVVTNGAGATAEAVIPVFGRMAGAHPPQVRAGTPVTVSWALPGAGVYVNDLMPAQPFSDVSSATTYLDVSDGSSPTAQRLTLSTSVGSVDYRFPQGFRFPYFGELADRFRIWAQGYISFNLESTVDTTNRDLPYNGAISDASVAIAPFWDDLSAQTTGEVWVDLRSDGEGRFLVVQWKNFQFDTANQNPSSLNFQVIFRENGVFEYRYGTMSSTNPIHANGSSATITFQDPFARYGVNVSNNSSATPRSNTALRFDLRLPAEGSLDINPLESTHYRICAPLDGGGMDCVVVPVVAVKGGDLVFSELMVTPTGAGLDPAGEWIEVRNASPFPIDVAGFTLTSGAETTTLGNGSPMIVQPGDFAVLTRAGGSVAGTWSYGTDITLDPADSLALNYGVLPVDMVSWDAGWSVPAGQSLRLDPVHFKRQPGANDARSAWCVSTELYDGANAGTPGTLGAGCTNTNYDIDPGARAEFIDITSDANKLAWTATGNQNVRAEVPGGMPFSFPYFGNTIARNATVGVTSSGFLAFATLTSGHTGNATMPGSAAPNGVMAPFWDDTYLFSFNGAYADHLTIGGQDVFVVQWNNLRISTSSYGGRLTYQTQLWQNGDIVFVYKEIDGGIRHTGDLATIGLENTAGTAAALYSHNTENMIWEGQTIRFRKR